MENNYCPIDTCGERLTEFNSRRGTDGIYYCWSCSTIK